MSQQRFINDDDSYAPQTSYYNNSRPVKIISEEPSGYTTRHFILYGICGCLAVTFIVLVSILFFNSYRGGIDHHKVDQMIAELNEDNTMQLNTRNMVSFSTLSTSLYSGEQLIKKNRLSLCYADLMKADTDDGKGVLTMNADQLSEDKNPFFYMLDIKLTLTFNVDPMLYMRDLQQIDIDRHYMTVAYLISSNYAHFSTIKLVETGLDTRNKALIRTNEVILCSDNPNNQYARSCTANNGGEESIFIKNTKLLAMSKLVPWSGSNTQKRKNTTRTTEPTLKPSGSATTDNGQYDITHTDSNINSYKVSDDFTRDLRMYNLVFYRLLPQTESNTRFATLKEEPVLSIKPSKCK